MSFSMLWSGSNNKQICFPFHPFIQYQSFQSWKHQVFHLNHPPLSLSPQNTTPYHHNLPYSVSVSNQECGQPKILSLLSIFWPFILSVWLKRWVLAPARDLCLTSHRESLNSSMFRLFPLSVVLSFQMMTERWQLGNVRLCSSRSDRWRRMG